MARINKSRANEKIKSVVADASIPPQTVSVGFEEFVLIITYRYGRAMAQNSWAKAALNN